MRTILISAALVLGFAASASAKTVGECNAEYAANKAAIQGAQTKADFVAACRAGVEVIPGAATAAAVAPVAPRPGLFGFGRNKGIPAPVAPAPTSTATGANEFGSDTQAKASCPADTVVWVNTHSHVYHFAGTHNYGHTNSGAFMCERAAQAGGNRAPLNEKHP